MSDIYQKWNEQGILKALEISLDELCKWEIEYLNLIEKIKSES